MKESNKKGKREDEKSDGGEEREEPMGKEQ